MQRVIQVLFMVLLCSVLVLNSEPAAGKSKEKEKKVKQVKPPTVLEFQTMVGVPRPYTGATNAIRGIPGGGLPWAIDNAFGELEADGKLEVAVSGLVFADGPNVGKNTVASFRAIVSCLSIDADGNPITVNVATETFPADVNGNCIIEDDVDLPNPCIAPIVFVTSPGGSWFASTGF